MHERELEETEVSFSEAGQPTPNLALTQSLGSEPEKNLAQSGTSHMCLTFRSGTG